MLDSPTFYDVDVGHDDAHYAGFERLAEDEDLLDVLTANVDVLDLLGDYVFTLGKLEYMLLPIDYFQGAVLERAEIVG